MKILLIVNMPWTRELGAPRANMEIAEEMERRGHVVHRFDVAAAALKSNRVSAFFQPARFSAQARRFVRKYGREYDVIQADPGHLPFFKREMDYDGMLVVRSNGLLHFHEQYGRVAKQSSPASDGPRDKMSSVSGDVLRFVARQTWGRRQVERSFAAADAIVLLNEDERTYVAETLGHTDKAFCLPNGLSEDVFAAFAAHATPPEKRQAAQQVVFIGRWVDIKGSRDLPRLARGVRQTLPDTRFLILGTGTGSDAVRADFHAADRPAVTVVPSFKPDALPALLREATVGVFTSYIEGFGMAVLEKLAAGIPTIAYDVPGPREMLRRFDPPAPMTPPGNIPVLTEQVIRLLTLSPPEYAALSLRARVVADGFRWRDVADNLLRIYQEKQPARKMVAPPAVLGTEGRIPPQQRPRT